MNIVTEKRNEVQQQPLVIHDTRNGQQATGFRVGDLVLTDDGMCRVVADGRKGLTLQRVVQDA